MKAEYKKYINDKKEASTKGGAWVKIVAADKTIVYQDEMAVVIAYRNITITPPTYYLTRDYETCKSTDQEYYFWWT